MMDIISPINVVLWAIECLFALGLAIIWLYTLLSRKPEVQRAQTRAFIWTAWTTTIASTRSPSTLPGPVKAVFLVLAVVGLVGFLVGMVRATLAGWAEIIARSAPPH